MKSLMNVYERKAAFYSLNTAAIQLSQLEDKVSAGLAFQCFPLVIDIAHNIRKSHGAITLEQQQEFLKRLGAANGRHGPADLQHDIKRALENAGVEFRLDFPFDEVPVIG